MEQIKWLSVIAFFLLIFSIQAGEKVKRWTISLEAGNGAILNLLGSYMIKNRFDIGLGAGFDVSKFTVEDTDYNSFLLNINAFAVYRFYTKDRIELQARLKPGFDYLKVGTFSTTCFELTPEILAGYFNFYAVFSGIVMFTKKISFVPQIGAGYRFRF